MTPRQTFCKGYVDRWIKLSGKQRQYVLLKPKPCAKYLGNFEHHMQQQTNNKDLKEIR